MKTVAPPSPKRLIVAVPGLGGRQAAWAVFRDALKADPAHANDYWYLHEETMRFYSNHGLEHFALNLHASIEEQFISSAGPFDEIILIGHSIGGLLVRSAYLLAANPNYLTNSTSEWAQHVSRIVLFAAPNRGIQISGAPFVLGMLGERAFPIVRDSLRGSNFLTDLKIGWILYFQRAIKQHNANLPVIIQVLGGNDKRVSRYDSFDVEQLPNGGAYLLPNADHRQVFRWDWLSANEQQARQDLLRKLVFTWPPTPMQVGPAQLDTSIKQVVFVLHGIRDAAPTWAQQLANNLRALPDTQVTVAEYGFFSAAKFLLPGIRRESIGWFQDAYTNALLCYPNADDYHFVGHSNGTYILGRSLERLKHMHFNRVYLAGSVLPETYDWSTRIKQKQVQAVRNDRSGGDWPVAVLCQIMNKTLRMKDVGAGGFSGFAHFNLYPTICSDYHYFSGDHGAPIQVNNHASITSFIRNGIGAGAPTMPMPGLITPFVQRWHTHGPAVALGLLLVLAALVLGAGVLVLQGHPSGLWLVAGAGAVLVGIWYFLDTV